LLVDFTNQRRAEGMGVTEALIDAGATRLRPILMTTLATIVGMLPAAIGHGEGGEMRSGMGITAIGGLTVSTLLTLLVVPVVYTLIEGVRRFLIRLASIFSRGKRAKVSERGAEPVTL
jgi:HAE1 family hydrophobic/amphiphilic exporter-1